MKNMKFHLHCGLVAKQIRMCEFDSPGRGCIFHFDFSLMLFNHGRKKREHWLPLLQINLFLLSCYKSQLQRDTSSKPLERNV